MDDLLTAIEGIAKEGADLTAIKEGLSGLNVNPLDTVIDKETALKFIRDNPFLNSAYDSGISKGVDSYKTRFSQEELPSLISAERQKIISELNPEETAAEKVAREFAEYKQAQEAKEKQGALEKELISTFDKIKAVDNGFKAEDLQHFVTMGDKGVEQFVKLNERIAEITKSKVEDALKGKYTVETPKKTQDTDYDFNAAMKGALGFLNK